MSRCVIILSLILWPSVASAEIAGKPRVIDGDTIEVAGHPMVADAF